MERKITRRRGGVLAALALLLAGAALAPQTAWAGDKKGKDGKVPIVIGTPIVTTDPAPPPKKK